MTHFMAEMHQIRFLLGLRPDHAGGAYSAPADPLAASWIWSLFLREGDGRGSVPIVPVLRNDHWSRDVSHVTYAYVGYT